MAPKFTSFLSSAKMIGRSWRGYFSLSAFCKKKKRDRNEDWKFRKFRKILNKLDNKMSRGYPKKQLTIERTVFKLQH